MSPADDIAAKMETTESAGAGASSDHKSDEHASLEHFQHTSNQGRPVENLHSLLLRISHHLDYETSERKNIYYRLQAIDDQVKRALEGQTERALETQTKRAPESQTKMRASRFFVRYLVAICIGVAGTLAWQSYGETTKQIIATRAPELGWSLQSKQMIASWVQQLGWTKPLAGPENAAIRSSAQETPQPAAVAQIAPETVASKAAAPPSLDAEQVQQIALSLTALRQTVDQIAANQDEMMREINKLLAADSEILLKIPAPPPQAPVAPARQPMPVPPSRAPIQPH